MSITVMIDGAAHTGHYRCTCECGAIWGGCGGADGIAAWSPCLPIAESVVHLRMCHAKERLDLDFTERFGTWLAQYWERESSRQANRGSYAGGQALSTRGFTR